MPCADYEALEARYQAWRDRGDDSDDTTVMNDDDDDDDQGNPDLEEENEAAIDDSIEASIRRATTSMFQRVFMFNQGAAESLYDDQMITTIEIL